MRNIEYRYMEIGDYKQINKMWKSDKNIGYSESDSKNKIGEFLLRNPNKSFVAMDGRKIVGTVLVGHDGRKGIINHLYVLPEYRKHHIAEQLLKRAERSLKDDNIYNCYVFVKKYNSSKKFWIKKKYKKQKDFFVFKKYIK